MITLKELQDKTGFSTFTDFKRNVTHTNWAALNPDWTTYYFYHEQKIKEADFDMKPEELDLAVESEKK